jgi:FkbM family methyltransferase
MPFVAIVENWRYSRLGTYEVTQPVPGTLVFKGFGKHVTLPALPQAQCELGLSPHERATILAVLSRIPSGSVAWDVGANVGFYTRLMSEVVGNEGRVIAFEPNIETFAELTAHTAGTTNISAICKGLSDQNGHASFATPADHSSASRIMSDTASVADDMVQITTVKGDTLVEDGGGAVPHFIKLDVEGHELRALNGMQRVLSSSGCCCVLVEVHFSLLEQGGFPHAPHTIRKLLVNCGLKKQQWISRSHLLAERS